MDYYSFLEILWWIFPLSVETVEGNEIHYLEPPFFLLRTPQKGFSSREAKGLVIVRKDFRVRMIFVAGMDRYRRYTVFHEYLEGGYLRHRRSRAEVLGSIVKKLLSVGWSSLTRELRKWVEACEEEQLPHAEALIDEILLARAEMGQGEFFSFAQARLLSR